MIKGCVICGAEFEARGSQKCCSDECANARRRNRSSERYRANRLPQSIECIVCGNRFTRTGNFKTCSEKCRKLKRKYDKKKHNKTPSGKARRKAQQNRWRFKNPSSDIKRQLVKQLGTEPPADLVEEATALRLLNRELRP